jgi:phage shock protein C
MSGRLMRSQTDRMFGGVCGGLGRYLNMDATLIRLAFVLFTLAGGTGFLVYLILLIVMPLDSTAENIVDYSPTDNETQRRTSMLVGGGLILAGLVYLMGRIPGLAWISFGNLWPLLLIIAGIAMIARIATKQED